MRPEHLDLHEVLELQRTVASGSPTRSTMRRMLGGRPEGGGRPLRIRFWRNCSVEHLFLPLEFFGALNGYDFTFAASAYDDALAFTGLGDDLAEGDVDVVVLERRRLNLEDTAYHEWLQARLTWLASVAGHPVVAVEVDQEGGPALTISVNGVNQWQSDEPGLVNPDGVAEVGSVLSAAGSSCLGRELGMVWIPAAVGSQKKVVVLDLDGTLHDGVLGEEGIGVRVTDGHVRLHQELLDARERGLMLSVVTKNDPADVTRLLAEHPRYLLRPEHLVAVEAGWDAKSLAVERVIGRTHVGADAVVFVDDNFAELAQVGAALPAVALVSCEHGPDEARGLLRIVEGYRTHRRDDLADLRTSDIVSDEDRRALLDASLGAYIAEARPCVTFLHPDREVLSRLADLSSRSNQFNLTLNRSGPERFEASLSADERVSAVAVRVDDRFSESGIVAGVLVAPGDDDRVEASAEELFMSCRVLGRGLEDTIAFGALGRAMDAVGADDVLLRWTRGPRNEPALRWLGHAFPDLEVDRGGAVRIDRARVADAATPPEGVTVRDEG